MLVIAADGALRRSLIFLFEAEGLEVVSHADLGVALRGRSTRSRCLVVDESVLVSDHDGMALLSAVTESIVVLFTRTVDLPSHLLFRTVQKPLVGAELIETVRMLLSDQDGTP